MFEKLKICWYVLTRHTFAIFFCTKDMKNVECYERNTFKVFNETIAEFMSKK